MQYHIKGISPECEEHYWNGTGWSDRPKAFTQSDADRLERRINAENEFIAIKEPA